MIKKVSDLAHYIEKELGMDKVGFSTYSYVENAKKISDYDFAIELMFDTDKRGWDYQFRNDTYRHFAIQNADKYENESSRTLLIHNIIDYIHCQLNIFDNYIDYSWSYMIDLLDYYFSIDKNFKPETDPYLYL